MTKPGTALTPREDMHDLPIAEQKKFVETALSTKLDKLPEKQQQAVLIAFGNHTGLRPELGEVMIYQGGIYVTIAGRWRNAHRHGLLMGTRPRPANDAEKRNAGYQRDDIVWICDVWRKGCTQPFTGWGKVTAKEIKAANVHTPQHKHPVEIARKRAQYDALRCAFPLDEQLSDTALGFILAAEQQIQAEQFPAPVGVAVGDVYEDETVPFEDEPPAIAAAKQEDLTFPDDSENNEQ
jgi:hypothetical protein